ncbi:MAG: nucleoside hydrolase [Legionella sp.]|uniref:nucleoside hydrolase n=1 Tax=Legionella sp. TaxID=459 RepID=UPI0039E5C21D
MKVIHDGDGAYEDVMALMLLLKHCDVRAVTLVYGEVHGLIGARNMERVCNYIVPECEIPVAYGRETPLGGFGSPFPDYIREEADNVLKGINLPEVSKSKVRNDAVTLIYETLMNSNEKITIIATGPLTNIAELIQHYPEAIKKIERIVIMGGAIHVTGNILDIAPNAGNTEAEWNIYADPLAAKLVFEAKIPLLLVPLDITNQVPLTKEFYNKIGICKDPALKLTYEMLTYFFETLGEKQVAIQLFFWDSLAAMIAINPNIADYQQLHLMVNLETAKTMVTKNSNPVTVAMSLFNKPLFYTHFIKMMTSPVPFSYKNTTIPLLSFKPRHNNVKEEILDDVVSLATY